MWNAETKARHSKSEGSRVFVSGSSKTQFKDSGYYRRNLPKGVSKAMTDRSTKGIAVILDEGANATRNNIKRMNSQGKPMSVYQLDKEGKRKDRKLSN